MDGYITIGTKLDTKSFDQQILDLERKANDLEKIVSSPKDIGLSPQEIHEVEVELEKTKNKLVGLYQQKMKLQQSGGFKELNNSLGDAIKKAGKLVLGIFSIRSAYLAVRRAASDLESYDPQFAANLEYIRWVLVQAIAPVLKWIVNLAGTLLSYIYAILNAWFGIGAKLDLSVDAFSKMKAGASGVSSAVKEIKKELLGFDEINRLTDQTDSGTAGGAGGIGLPDFDIGNAGELPDFIKWLKGDMGPVVRQSMQTLIDWIRDNWGKVGEYIAYPMQAGLDIFDSKFSYLQKSFFDLVEFIKALFEGDLSKAWDIVVENFNDCVNTILDIGATFLEFLYNIMIKPWVDMFNWLWSKITGEALETTDILEEDFEGLSNNIEENFEDTGEEVESVWTQLGNWFSQKWTDIGNWFNNKWLELQYNIELGKEHIIQKFTQLGQNISEAWTNMKNGAVDAWEGIKNTFSRVAQFFGDTFSSAWQRVKEVFSTGGRIFDGIKEGIVSSFTNIVNRIIDGINRVVSVPFEQLNSRLYTIRNVEVLGIRPFSWLPNVSIPHLPRLAVGGIVNMPNKGTYVGGAIAGESGKEGVIPLTDQQAMAELGREIGKNVLINLTNITSMNGRVISRELKNIQSEQNFAYNV